MKFRESRPFELDFRQIRNSEDNDPRLLIVLAVVILDDGHLSCLAADCCCYPLVSSPSCIRRYDG